MIQNPAECIILAGGLGTRLRGTIGELPKCMAPVAGKPFLHYLFRYIAAQGISRVVLSLGYKSEAVIDWLSSEDWPFTIDWVIEQEPLGTGGGIRLALELCTAPDIFVLNGDTMFQVDLSAMCRLHTDNVSATTIALKNMHDFDRYGTVNLALSTGIILGFEEKSPRKEGLINGGVYLLNREYLAEQDLPTKCSFEKDYLEPGIRGGSFFGYPSDGYFIDIGVPEDYARAQHDFQSLFSA